MAKPPFTHEQFTANNPYLADETDTFEVYESIAPLADTSGEAYRSYDRLPLDDGSARLSGINVTSNRKGRTVISVETGYDFSDMPESKARDVLESGYVDISLSHDGAMRIDRIVGDEAEGLPSPLDDEQVKEILTAIKGELSHFAAQAIAANQECKHEKVAIDKWIVSPSFGLLEKIAESDARSLLSGGEYEHVAPLLGHYDLGPKYKQSVGNGASVYFSSIFSQDETRKYVIAYGSLPDGATIPQVLYTSRSQQSWRWMPGQSESGWLDKATGEDTLDVAPAVQKALYEILEDDTLRMPPDDIESVLGNTVLVPRVVKGDTSRLPATKHYEVETHIELDEELLPNFGALVDTVSYTDELYGDMSIDSFLSRDEQVLYRFGRNHEGMAWLVQSSIVNSPIRLNGVTNNNVFRFHPLSGQPGYEYAHEMTSNSQYDRRRGSYRDNFDYLSNQRLIEDYYETIPVESLPFKEFIPEGAHPTVEMYDIWQRVHSEYNYAPLRHEDIALMFQIAAMIDGNVRDNPIDASTGRRNDYLIPLHIQGLLKQAEQDQSSAAERTAHPPTDPIYDGSFEAKAYELSLEQLGFTMTYSAAELYDDAIEYQHFVSPHFPDCRLEITRTADAMIGFDASYIDR